MPSTGSGADKSLSPGPGAGDAATKVSKSGSMKIKRTVSGPKMMTKSKSSGSLKKKAEKGEPSSSGHSPRPSAKDDKRVSLAALETGSLLAPRQNGSLRRGGGGGGGWVEEEAELEEEEVLEQGGEEKKEPSIKGLWKKAFKSMKSPGSDSKWLKPSSFKRRDSKYTDEEQEEEEPKEIDPVYSLLKCAADLPKIARSLSKEGQPSGGCQGAQCLGKASSPAPPGTPLVTSSGGTCVSCGGHLHKNEASSAHSLGHDFKQFYKQTSPIKRLSSSELGI